MPSINISSMTSYYGKATAKGSSGSASGSGSASMAQEIARRRAGAVGYASPRDQSGSTYSSYSFGSSAGGVSWSDQPFTETLINEDTWQPYTVYGCTSQQSRTGKMYQLKLNFSLPGVSANLIASAKLKFSCSGDTSLAYSICNGAGTYFLRYNDSGVFSNTTSFTPSSASSGIDITTIFKQCITSSQGYITILYASSKADRSGIVTVSGTPVIEYTLTYTKCGAPTSVSSTVDIQKPTGTTDITWSGATAGTNMTIQNYTVYWKVGGVPTASSYTGSATSTSSPYTFTIPVNATRGDVYYFKIVTNGSVSGWSSDISSNYATVKINSLPAAPTVVGSSSRIRSDGSTVTFTVTAGADPDTGQELHTYWATATDGVKTEISEGTYTTPELNSAITYYFWTSDGLEYSETYTSKPITVNIAPSIETFNMIAIATYTPTVQSRSYVKDIRIDTPVVTSDPAAVLTYDWQFLIGDATSSTAPAIAETVFGHATSYSKLDVTTGGVSFNNSYKIQLTITDDLGESYTLASTNEFCIPNVPTVVIYNQKDDSNISTANPSHFGRYIRVKYSEENNGINKELQIATSNAFTKYSTISLTDTVNTDVDLNNLIHGTNYYFQIKYICNSIFTYATFNPAEGEPLHPNYINRTRSADITPQSITATQQSGNSITPYTDTLFNIQFTNQPLAFTSENDVATTYSDIYAISLLYSTRSLDLTSSGSVSQGTVIGNCILNDISTSDWITLINGNNSASAPNGVYDVSLKVIAENQFGEQFQKIVTISLDFIEGIYNKGTASLEIQTGTNSWKTIPNSYQGLTLENRYPTFETQTLRINYSGLQVYANQWAYIYFMNGDTVLKSTTIKSDEWIAPSTAGNYIYTLNGNKYITYTLPAINTAEVRNYSVRIVLTNEKEDSIISSNITTNNNLNTTSIHRFIPSSINFAISAASEDANSGVFNATWTCTDFGGSVENTKYTNTYSTIAAQLQCCNTPTGTYTDVGSAVSLPNVGTTSMSNTGDLSGSTSSILYDIVYFGAKLVVTLRFADIDNETPTGTSVYTYYYKNQKVLYRATPNLLYGKNYFVLNATIPTTGITDQILELHGTATRKTIYIGDLIKGKLTITNNGLTIDNFTINCGTWSNNQS